VDTASNIAAMKLQDLKRWTKREDVEETVRANRQRSTLPCRGFGNGLPNLPVMADACD
jgi:hypothetical protein